MPEKVDILDAQEESQEKWTELDTRRLVHRNRINKVTDLVEDLSFALKQDFYYDEDVRGTAYDALKLIDDIEGRLDDIRAEVFAQV